MGWLSTSRPYWMERLPPVGLGPVGVHPQHQAAVGGFIQGEVLLPLLKNHLGVEGALPLEDNFVRAYVEGGQGSLQAGELTFLIAQGVALPFLLAKDALGDQLHHVLVSGLQALDPSN